MIKAITERLFVLEVAGATLIIFVGIAVFATGGYGGNHFGFSHYSARIRCSLAFSLPSTTV